MSFRWLSLFLVLTATAAACNTAPSQPAPAPAKPKPARKAKAPVAKASPESSASAEPINVPSSDHYGLPFAFEKADTEPLGMTRSFLADVIRDNEKYMQRGKPFFDPLKKSQQPRATVITCADSRLQSTAWDETPENDDFTIRNIGNQVFTSLGSVQYGIEHLNTPVLLILGHTGCGAVKAVLTKEHELPKPILAELEGIKLQPDGSEESESAEKAEKSAKHGKHEKADANNKAFEAKWTVAVIENVHHQVRQALTKFGPRVVTGKLTVIGAVYDLVNAFGKGPGRIGIVDVNGNSEPARLKAFVAAVQESRKKPAQPAAPAAEGPGQEFITPETALNAVNAMTPPIPTGAPLGESPEADVKAAFMDVPGIVTGGSRGAH